MMRELSAASLIGHNGCHLLFRAGAGVGEACSHLRRADARACAAFMSLAYAACGRFKTLLKTSLAFGCIEVEISVADTPCWDVGVICHSWASGESER